MWASENNFVMVCWRWSLKSTKLFLNPCANITVCGMLCISCACILIMWSFRKKKLTKAIFHLVVNYSILHIIYYYSFSLFCLPVSDNVGIIQANVLQPLVQNEWFILFQTLIAILCLPLSFWHNCFFLLKKLSICVYRVVEYTSCSSTQASANTGGGCYGKMQRVTNCFI